MLPYNESFVHVQWRPQSWMQDMRSYIEHLAITQVFLVGSHNAATYGIRENSPFGGDAPGLLRKRTGFAAMVHLMGGGVSARWAKCQALPVRAQLDAGVRYLDLRVVPNPHDGGRLYTTHSQISVPLSDVIEDVRAFLSDDMSASEFLVLDFQHLFEMNDVSTQHRFVRELDVILRHFIPADVPLTTPLSALWQASREQRVFLLVEALGVPCAAARLRSEALVSLWVDQKSLRKLLRSLNDMLLGDLQVPSEGSVPTKLYVTQAVLTPDMSNICFGPLNPVSTKSASSIREMAVRVNSPLLEWFCTLNAHSQLDGETVTVPPAINTHGNILMVDFVELGLCRVMGETRELNAVGMCIYLTMLRASRQEAAAPNSDG
ncbi:glycosylphosphatidylinositol-specific phospholipase C [Trypanosoma grayi]|uniref:glycosylphosphatidylinositol-specific phospholipase C n=1 Tax=Trypanosoma grayi TaxID=71804 RepID=UPI0004F44ED4|nr:glycosylphosphatidylinositol-specific phospholipase C [Trypanosoma grayi]KEG07749.1 glycosylphosphatidylinositol-specific phospholipase C [Trypanosoma grayi]